MSTFKINFCFNMATVYFKTAAELSFVGTSYNIIVQTKLLVLWPIKNRPKINMMKMLWYFDVHTRVVGLVISGQEGA